MVKGKNMGFYVDLHTGKTHAINHFNIKKHMHCFKTEPNEAYFWHGRTSVMYIGFNDLEYSSYPIGGQENAEMIARKNGGKTLEMCMREHRDELELAGVHFNDETGEIRYGDNEIENKEFWDRCSEAFAKQASGDIHVIEGRDPRITYHENNIATSTPEENYKEMVWNRIERPKLEENTDVISITHVDAITGEETDVERFDYYNGMGI